MRPLVLVMALALAGCLGAEQSAEQIARNQAKGVVNGVVADRFPGVNSAPITDCIIDNATLPEVLDIAKGAVAGPDQSTVGLVLTIAGRPETQSCVLENGVLPGLGTLLPGLSG